MVAGSIPLRLVQRLREKRLIFTVTTGRSGTKLLSRLLRLVPNVRSLHEPFPEFVEVMRNVQSDPQLGRRFLIERKFPVIAEIPEKIYIETSHLFCKGFLEPMVSLGLTPDLILLGRDKRAVAQSLFLINSIPGKSAWYLSPGDPGVLLVADWTELHDYQLCYWYCLEMERRAAVYRKLVQDSGGRVASTNVDRLGSLSGFNELLVELGLGELPPELNDQFESICNQPFNTKSDTKEAFGRFSELEGLQLDSMEQEVLERIEASGRQLTLMDAVANPAQDEFDWIGRTSKVREAVTRLREEYGRILLLDDGKLPADLLSPNEVVPLIGHKGVFYGRPRNERHLLSELRSEISKGAEVLLICWPAFWWLSHYPGFNRQLKSKWTPIMGDDAFIAYAVTDVSAGE